MSYTATHSEIKYRLDYASKELKVVTEILSFESAVLQVRKSIELVALGTLAANKNLLQEISTTLLTKNWNEARKILRNMNSEYWPIPFKSRESDNRPDSLIPIDAPFLTEDESGAAWGFLSDLLHANNPFGREVGSIRRVRRATG